MVFVSEVLKELKENFILGLLTRLHLGVHGAVVNSSKVGGSDGKTAIGVELKERLVNHSLSLSVEGSANSDKELVEVDVTIIIGVEKTRVELVGVDLVVAIEGVKVSEGTSETSDGLGSTRFDLLLDSLKKLNSGTGWCLGHCKVLYGLYPIGVLRIKCHHSMWSIVGDYLVALLYSTCCDGI